LALMEMYVEGVSTRKVKDITEELCGTSFPKSLVSQLATRLDAELQTWRSRPLEGEGYPYLFVDARYEKARTNGRVVSQGVLIVCAVREDGLREILAVEVADTESLGPPTRGAVPLPEEEGTQGGAVGGLRRS
jgi:putative transposase